MATITITANGIIFFGGTHVGSVAQERDGTIVRDRHGERVNMPHARYSLAFDRPDSGIPGRADFERDLWDALGGYV